MPYYKVKVLVEEEYIVEVKEYTDIEEQIGVAKFLAGSPRFSTIVNKREISKKPKLIKNPHDHSSEKRTSIDSKYGDHYSMKKFKKMVDGGSINDYDGIGYYADKEFEYHHIYSVEQLDQRYTHVMWYNK